MIHLYLTRDLAMHVASYLPLDDPLRTGIAETIAEQDLLGGVIDQPAAMTILRNGHVYMEIFNEEEAERTYEVLTAPRALQSVALAAGKAVRVDAAFETLAAALGVR